MIFSNAVLWVCEKVSTAGTGVSGVNTFSLIVPSNPAPASSVSPSPSLSKLSVPPELNGSTNIKSLASRVSVTTTL